MAGGGQLLPQANAFLGLWPCRVMWCVALAVSYLQHSLEAIRRLGFGSIAVHEPGGEYNTADPLRWRMDFAHLHPAWGFSSRHLGLRFCYGFRASGESLMRAALKAAIAERCFADTLAGLSLLRLRSPVPGWPCVVVSSVIRTIRVIERQGRDAGGRLGLSWPRLPMATRPQLLQAR